MSDIHIRKSGKCGRITLMRPKALNAVSHDMCLEIEAALDLWADDDNVAMVVIDAVGDKAFCAGGDIRSMYETAVEGDYEFGRNFWRDEYRMNAKISNYAKPFVAFMQGFTLGGGVGISCHGSHRIVCETSRIGMPETGIGLIPDVGGTVLLARAPGRLGEYLGTTGERMDAGNAIYAKFADYFIPYAAWDSVIKALEETGDITVIASAAQPAPEAGFVVMQSEIDACFGGKTIADVLRALRSRETDFSQKTLKTLAQKSPLATACAHEIVDTIRPDNTVKGALEHEFRFTYRSAESGDFIEGIRALLIDKDNQPKWRHPDLDAVTDMDVSKMLMPLGDHALQL